MHISRWLVGLVLLAMPIRAWTLPISLSAESTVDDASVRITVLNKHIRGDAKSSCTLQLTVGSEEVAITAGDAVTVSLYEDDLVGDDLLWTQSFEATANEASAGLIERSFDCSSDFGDDGAALDLYGYAYVEKEECGFWCAYDAPETPVIEITTLDDDGKEDDDTAAQAHDLTLGEELDRISKDQDWWTFEIPLSTQVEIRATHLTALGRIELDLFDSGINLIASGELLAHETMLEVSELSAGTYYVRAAPQVSNDYNFFDVWFQVEALESDCTPTAVQTEPCGNCGTRTRTCGSGGTWEPWQSCAGEGACTPLSTQSLSCGICGTLTQTCSNTCSWGSSGCEDPCAQAGSLLGSPCESDTACVDLGCIRAPAFPMFGGGYCSLVGCTSSEECGDNGLCASAFNLDFCLLRCANDDNCRDGYQCVETPEGKGCIPSCIDDSDCRDTAAPLCDVASGRCIPASSGTTGSPGELPPEGQGDVTAESVPPPPGGCANVLCAPWWLFALVLWRQRKKRGATEL